MEIVMKRLMFAYLALAVMSCGTETDISGPPEEITFAPELGVDLSAMTQTPSGTYWQDLLVGTGAEVLVGMDIAVHYTGWLPNGHQFDSSRGPGRGPFPWVVGEDGIIAGWNDGVPGMLVGGVRLLVIPPKKAYGDAGAPPTIPANTTLVFEIEVLDIVQGVP